jgi:hypothetical protein
MPNFYINAKMDMNYFAGGWFFKDIDDSEIRADDSEIRADDSEI